MPYFKKDTRGVYWKLLEVGNEASWMNQSGYGHNFLSSDLQNYEIYEAENFKDFVMDEAYLKDTLEYGWIDLAGNFWGCEMEEHENLLLDVLKSNKKQAFAEGWVHVSRYNWIALRGGITFEQAETLERIGRKLQDRRYRSLEVKFEDVFPDGYDRSLLPKTTARRVHPEGDLSGVNARPETSAPHLKY